MKNIGIILLFGILFFGAGCGKNASDNFEVDMNADCNKADYPFACFLDKSTAARDPNLCNDLGSKRITCISAYEELLEEEVACDTLTDQTFQMECEQYKQSQNRPNTESDIISATSTQPDTDPAYMNN